MAHLIAAYSRHAGTSAFLGRNADVPDLVFERLIRKDFGDAEEITFALGGLI